MVKFTEKVKKTNWKDKLREKQGRKGLLPWISVSIQKWILIGVIFMATLVTLISTRSGGYIPGGLIFTIIVAFACYVGFKTNWLKNVDNANKPLRVAGAIVVGAGALAAIIFAAISIFYIVIGILLIVLFFAILFFVLKTWLSGDEGKGKKVIKQNGRTYRQNWMGNWEADKDWTGNDKVERDWLGNPKIETDWKGDQKIERDWKGDPIIPPKKDK
jgi:ABC-type cobalt transport system substrate-binding protein